MTARKHREELEFKLFIKGWVPRGMGVPNRKLWMDPDEDNRHYIAYTKTRDSEGTVWLGSKAYRGRGLSYEELIHYLENETP